MANYDNAALFYDALAGLVYGKALKNAQAWLLEYIPAGSSVLVAGGGTGWILEAIAQRFSGLQITYVEISQNMMARSKKKNKGSNQVDFINLPIESYTSERRYDVVTTCFLFDNFTQHNCERIFTHINKQLKPGGVWLNADFRLTGKWWQTLLLKAMLTFFRILCGIESRKLPDMEDLFAAAGYTQTAEQSFYGQFIRSTVYRKAGDQPS